MIIHHSVEKTDLTIKWELFELNGNKRSVVNENPVFYRLL
jgi:hypothetical protein